jgi:hypothetical protein
MRIKSKLESLEKRLGINKQQMVLMVGREQSWDDITEEEHERLPEDELEWIFIQDAIAGGHELVLTGCDPRTEINRRKELGIW